MNETASHPSIRQITCVVDDLFVAVHRVVCLIRFGCQVEGVVCPVTQKTVELVETTIQRVEFRIKSEMSFTENARLVTRVFQKIMTMLGVLSDIYTLGQECLGRLKARAAHDTRFLASGGEYVDN